eukprot:4705651-Heterocapsa_arctica.AAC.1
MHETRARGPGCQEGRDVAKGPRHRLPQARLELGRPRADGRPFDRPQARLRAEAPRPGAGHGGPDGLGLPREAARRPHRL